MPNPPITVGSPAKGINQVVNREGQPPDTCWDALNVLPFDTYGRRRAAQRFGTSKAFTTQLTSSTVGTQGPVQGLASINIVGYPSSGGSGGGSTTYNETFSSLSEFQDSWANVPSTWTVSGSALNIPASWTPSSTDAPLLFRPDVVMPGNVQMFITYQIEGATSSDGPPVNLWIGLNPTAPTQNDVDNGTTALDYNFGDNGFAGGSDWSDTGPLVYSSTTGTFISSSTSGTFPFTQVFSTRADYLSSTASAVLQGIATNVNSDGPPNTGTLTVSLSGSQFLFLWVDQLQPGVSMKITQLKIIYPSNTSALVQSQFASLLVAVCEGFVWYGGPSPADTMQMATGQSTAPLSGNPTVSMAAVNFTGISTDANAVNQAVYIVDGITQYPVVFNTSTHAITTIVPKSSTNPSPTYCSLACNWRGRLVLAGDPSAPQNFYMSRAGDPSDWDYSQVDPAAAVAGNLSQAGKIGEPITALIPYTDDYMLIGCAHSLWMLEGDPADGGSIVMVSNQMGIVGKDAWCVSPDGTLYFVASGGLYSVKPIWEFYQPPQLLSANTLNQFFQSIPWNLTITSMVWDADLHYLYCFFTPVSGQAGIHIVFDSRTEGGLWKIQFTATNGPFSSCLYLSDNAPGNRAILLGGWDGYIRQTDTTALDDDGQLIACSVTLGPWHPSPEASLLSATTIDLGELGPGAASSTWGATAYLASGPDAFSVTEGGAHSSTAIAITLDRRQKTFRQRLRGGWFSLRLANGVDKTYFSFESATLEFKPAGRNRERR